MSVINLNSIAGEWYQVPLGYNSRYIYDFRTISKILYKLRLISKQTNDTLSWKQAFISCN